MADARASAESYFELKSKLNGEFYSLNPTQRIKVLSREGVYILLFCTGYAYAAFNHFMPSFTGLPAHAAVVYAAGGVSVGITREAFIGYLISHLAIVGVLAICVFNVLFGKKKNDWAKSTATFLLGFLTKAGTPFLPPF